MTYVVMADMVMAWQLIDTAMFAMMMGSITSFMSRSKLRAP